MTIVTRFDLAAEQSGPYAAAWDRHNDIALHQPGLLWVALGDSLTQGVGASSWDQGWVHQAQRQLAATGRDYRVVNLSRTGATTADILDRQLPTLADLGHEPDVVTLLIGSNDMIRPALRRHLWDRYAALLTALPPRTVLSYLPQPLPLAHRINAAIDAAAATSGLHPVNLRPAVRHVLGHRASDLFHPNDRGYQRIAAIFADGISAQNPP